MVWHGYRGGEKEAFEKVIANFNQANAGKIKVTTLAVPYDAFAIFLHSQQNRIG